MQRERLIKELKQQGITHPQVIQALTTIPREKFVPPALSKKAYANTALPIACQQTISQPYIVGLMSQALFTHPFPQKILEIGTGSGYQTAVLAHLFEKVFTIERIRTLHLCAQQTLNSLHFENIHYRLGNGFQGWPEEAPFDAIIVTAAPTHLPSKLINQLSSQSGIMIIPIGKQNEVQKLTLIKKTGAKLEQHILSEVVFVPLINDK